MRSGSQIVITKERGKCRRQVKNLIYSVSLKRWRILAEYFAWTEDDPYLFWEEEWGTINYATYCERKVPLINGMVQLKQDLSMMQDNAPTRYCGRKQARIFWRGPSYLLIGPLILQKFNLIEHVKDNMEDYMEYHQLRLYEENSGHMMTLEWWWTHLEMSHAGWPSFFKACLKDVSLFYMTQADQVNSKCTMAVPNKYRTLNFKLKIMVLYSFLLCRVGP